MIAFKRSHPGVRFVLEQGEYTTISEWVKNGTVDFGFVNMDAAPEMEGRLLYADEMCAVMPPDHVLTRQSAVSLADLSREALILLDEGELTCRCAPLMPPASRRRSSTRFSTTTPSSP